MSLTSFMEIAFSCKPEMGADDADFADRGQFWGGPYPRIDGELEIASIKIQHMTFC